MPPEVKDPSIWAGRPDGRADVRKQRSPGGLQEHGVQILRPRLVNVAVAVASDRCVFAGAGEVPALLDVDQRRTFLTVSFRTCDDHDGVVRQIGQDLAHTSHRQRADREQWIDARVLIPYVSVLVSAHPATPLIRLLH